MGEAPPTFWVPTQMADPPGGLWLGAQGLGFAAYGAGGTACCAGFRVEG